MAASRSGSCLLEPVERHTANRSPGCRGIIPVVICSLPLVVPLNLRAAAPTVDYLFPAGGQAGTTIPVTVGGKLEPWPVKIWVDSPGLKFTAGKTNGSFNVQIAKDVAPGPHLVRFFNDDGASVLRTFVVGTIPEILEKEPNNHYKQAQIIEKLPVTINGRLEKNGDLDSFAVRVEAGKWLVAQVDGYGLGSPIDPYLHLLDADGGKLAFANDTATFDPLLAWKVEKSGIYILQLAAFEYPPVADVRFAGKESAVYRLTLTDGPYVEHTFPAGARRGAKTELHLLGWNLPDESSELDLTGISATQAMFQFMAPGAGKPLALPLSDLPELFEIEPNDNPAQPQAVSFPCVINGRIDPAGDVDRFAFTAKKDEQIEIGLRSAELGFLLDGLLEVEDKDGKQLNQNDDSTEGGFDPMLVVETPADGRYVVSVSDLKHQGGRDFIYRLEIKRAESGFRATVDSQSYVLETGKTVEVKVNVDRLNKDKEKLVARVLGLPEGISVKGGEVPGSGGEVKLTLSAPEKCERFSGSIRVIIAASEEKPERTVLAQFNLKDKEAPSDLLVNQTSDLWLTVKPPAPPEAKKPEKK